MYTVVTGTRLVTWSMLSHTGCHVHGRSIVSLGATLALSGGSSYLLREIVRHACIHAQRPRAPPRGMMPGPLEGPSLP